jgi:hypothetical protein
MNKSKLFAIGVLVVLTAYAVCATLRANRLQKRFSELEVSYDQLQEKHRHLKESYLSLVQSPVANDQAFRQTLAILESKGGMDLILPLASSRAQLNAAPSVQIK